jgi:copper chaperone
MRRERRITHTGHLIGAPGAIQAIHDYLDGTMESLHLTIEGMTCEHCVRAVDGRLRKTPGVEVERVVVGAADVRFDPATIDADEISEVIADEGYTAFVA